MKLKKIIMILGCAAMLCACTKSNIVTPEGTAAPDMTLKKNVKIDWQQVKDDLNEDYVDNIDYPYCVDVDLNADDDSAYIMVTVQDDTTQDQALELATQLISACNDAVVDQDHNYAVSEEGYYGGYAETHNIWIQVMPESTKEDEDTWLVDDVIIAGDQDAVSPDGWLSKMDTTTIEKPTQSGETEATKAQ